jgi:hypothetical protein
MSRCKLRTPWPIHFKLLIVIGIDSLRVCILYGEISIFHSRVMVTLEWKIEISPKSIQTVRLSIPIYVRSLKWIWPRGSQFTVRHTKNRLQFDGLYTFWWNLDFSFKSYGKESLYKYCMNVDDGRIMRSWRSCLFN